MIFEQEHNNDFNRLMDTISPGYNGPAIAFARYADGEAACIWNRSHRAKSDGWEWHGGRRSELSQRLLDSLRCDLFGWHLGITAESHHAKDHSLLLSEARIGLSFITMAEVFIFANYQKFQGMSLDHCCHIGIHGEATVPSHPEDTEWPRAIDELVPFMVECSRPMLVSAGPWACVLIHEYWKRCPKHMRRVVLDVGSAMDERYKGRRTRVYQRPSSGLWSWKPTWKL